MKRYARLTTLWAGALLTVLLTAACSSDGGGEVPVPQHPMLDIYVYAPDYAMPTRAADGIPVEASDEENNITLLQVWLYKHGTEERLGYLELRGEQLANLNNRTLRGEYYRMEVPDSFANAAERPNVDVYVLANVTQTNCGDAKDKDAHRSDPEEGSLERVHIAPNYYCPQQGVPADGLPMSGVLRNTAVTGTSPVLHIGRITLQRAVSKIRFVFSRKEGLDNVNIRETRLDGNAIPQIEYLFLEDGKDTNVGGGYQTASTTLLRDVGNIAANANPAEYRYEYNGNLTTFADKIDQGVAEGKLTEAPTVYLRESDKKLSGTIYYQVGNDASYRSASFSMSAEGSFARNHVWIVYGYFSASQLELQSVDVSPWVAAGEQDNGLYNW